MTRWGFDLERAEDVSVARESEESAGSATKTNNGAPRPLLVVRFGDQAWSSEPGYVSTRIKVSRAVLQVSAAHARRFATANQAGSSAARGRREGKHSGVTDSGVEDGGQAACVWSHWAIHLRVMAKSPILPGLLPDVLLAEGSLWVHHALRDGCAVPICVPLFVPEESPLAASTLPAALPLSFPPLAAEGFCLFESPELRSAGNYPFSRLRVDSRLGVIAVDNDRALVEDADAGAGKTTSVKSAEPSARSSAREGGHLASPIRVEFAPLRLAGSGALSAEAEENFALVQQLVEEVHLHARMQTVLSHVEKVVEKHEMREVDSEDSEIIVDSDISDLDSSNCNS